MKGGIKDVPPLAKFIPFQSHDEPHPCSGFPQNGKAGHAAQAWLMSHFHFQFCQPLILVGFPSELKNRMQRNKPVLFMSAPHRSWWHALPTMTHSLPCPLFLVEIMLLIPTATELGLCWSLLKPELRFESLFQRWGGRRGESLQTALVIYHTIEFPHVQSCAIPYEH